MSEPDDDVLDAIKKAIDAHPGMSIMPQHELDQFMAAGADMIAQHDALAKAQGRRFLDEEQDQELIETWHRDAAQMTNVDDACVFCQHLLSDYRHDYGTICHALVAGSYAMLCAMNADELSGGYTGLQASVIAWMLYKRVLHLPNNPMRMIDYSDLLYPQMDEKFTVISEETNAWLIAKAQEKLAENPDAHPHVIERWTLIANGELPWFMTVEKESP